MSHFCWRLLISKFAGAALLAFAIAATQYVPRTLAVNSANSMIGGCSSGLCGSETVGLCAYSGDACAGYVQCASNEDGPNICTPQSYCGGAGCGANINGGVCN
jgi:hypothetical protein